MTITTKLDINDAIYFLHEQKVIQSIVQQIIIHASLEEHSIVYLCNTEKDQRVNLKVNEQYAFNSKADLLKSL